MQFKFNRRLMSEAGEATTGSAAPDTANTTAPTEPKPQTRAEVLAADRAALMAKNATIVSKIATIDAEIAGLAFVSSLVVGSRVAVHIGKGDTAAWRLGYILAVKTEDDGAVKFKVQYGTGFDTDVTVVGVAKLQPDPTAAAADAAEAQA